MQKLREILAQSLRVVIGLFTAALRGMVISGVLAAVVLWGAGNVEKTGDKLQIALPLLAWGCSAANGDGAEFLGRYLVQFALVHGMKRSFGDAEFNTRPSGGPHGMPSAHTSTAVLGASRLARDCVSGNPVVQAAVVLSAGFVGASRVDADKHTVWQVLAGAVLGLLCDRAFGKGSASRAFVSKKWRKLRAKKNALT